MTGEEKDRQETMDHSIMILAKMCKMCLDIGRGCAAIAAFLAEEYGTGGGEKFMAELAKILDPDAKKDVFKDMKDFKTELN